MTVKGIFRDLNIASFVTAFNELEGGGYEITINTGPLFDKSRYFLCYKCFHFTVPEPYHVIFSFLLPCQNIDILSETFFFSSFFFLVTEYFLQNQRE